MPEDDKPLIVNNPLMKIDVDGNVEIIPEPLVVNALCEHRGVMYAATNHGVMILQDGEMRLVPVGPPIDE